MFVRLLTTFRQTIFFGDFVYARLRDIFSLKRREQLLHAPFCKQGFKTCYYYLWKLAESGLRKPRQVPWETHSALLLLPAALPILRAEYLSVHSHSKNSCRPTPWWVVAQTAIGILFKMAITLPGPRLPCKHWLVFYLCCDARHRSSVLSDSSVSHPHPVTQVWTCMLQALSFAIDSQGFRLKHEWRHLPNRLFVYFLVLIKIIPSLAFGRMKLR